MGGGRERERKREREKDPEISLSLVVRISRRLNLVREIKFKYTQVLLKSKSIIKSHSKDVSFVNSQPDS